jgi:hypothetical protein
MKIVRRMKQNKEKIEHNSILNASKMGWKAHDCRHAYILQLAKKRIHDMIESQIIKNDQ